MAADKAEVPPGVVASFNGGPVPSEGLRLPDFDATLATHLSMPLMAPELALQAFQDRGRQGEVPSYTDETLIMAELPETSQRGAFELQRTYTAPHTVSYKPIQFTGDAFVKTSVITRILQSEVEYVAKGEAAQQALSSTNYKFSSKGLQELNGHSVYAYQVKPREKRAGLFKGRIYLDAHTGSLVRSEGAVAKSPSFFVKNLEFVQDFVDVGRYTLPTHLHTSAKARILGKTVVDVYHREYQLQPVSASFAPHSAVGQP